MSCASCQADVPPGSRFCTSCGEPVAAETTTGGGPGRAAWIIAAAAILVVLLIVFLPRRAERVPAPRTGTEAPFAGQTGGGAGAGLGELSSDMRSNADRLFNRIMMAAEQGNQAEVDQFMPMAIQAYGMVDNLDDDGIYHLAILQQTAGEYGEARSAAERILEHSPDHILALGVAASAAADNGDTAAASSLWQRLLEAYPEEAGKPLPEYMDHQAMLQAYRDSGRAAVGGQ